MYIEVYYKYSLSTFFSIKSEDSVDVFACGYRPFNPITMKDLID